MAKGKRGAFGKRKDGRAYPKHKTNTVHVSVELRTKQYPQSGKTSAKEDRGRDAKKPGWRRSGDTGKWYFERRKNRSDKKGKEI